MSTQRTMMLVESPDSGPDETPEWWVYPVKWETTTYPDVSFRDLVADLDAQPLAGPFRTHAAAVAGMVEQYGGPFRMPHNAFVDVYGFTDNHGEYKGPKAVRAAIARGVRKASRLPEDVTRRADVRDRLYSHAWLRPRAGETLGSLARAAERDAWRWFCHGTEPTS